MKHSTGRTLLLSSSIAAWMLYPTLLRGDEGQAAAHTNRLEVSERFERLRGELTNNFNNHVITSDQYSVEMTKLDQLKIQEQADVSQNQGDLTDDQRKMYNDLLSHVQRDIDQMLETTASPSSAVPAATSTVLPDDQGRAARRGEKGNIYERFQRLRSELTTDLSNHLITSGQYHDEITKLDQLKIQAHADTSQDNLNDQQSMFNDALNQIQQDIDQMLETNSAPPPPQ